MTAAVLERPAPPPSWELVTRAQAGDREAFAQIYDEYLDVVYRFVFHRCHNRQLAEDLTSETFVRALRRIGSVTYQGRDIGAWLIVIARNIVVDHFKSGRYRLEQASANADVFVSEPGGPMDRADLDRDSDPEAATLDYLANLDLLAALRTLVPLHQQVLTLRFLHGLSVAETAEVMGKKQGAVKALQFRAVRALARNLPEGFVR